MKWEEVKSIYPNKFVSLTSLKSHIEDNIKYIDDVAVVKELSNEEANKLILKCRGETFVYHTSKEKLEMDIVTMPTLTYVAES